MSSPGTPTPAPAVTAATVPVAPPQSLDEWLAYVESLHPQSIAMGLERSRAVAERLGLKLAVPVITVGGTNGKGSTCSLLEAILLAAGYRVGLYIKPHLISFNERARLNGQSATDAELLPHFAAVEAARTAAPTIELTYYEFTTLAIMQLFAHTPLDVIILEVGLGGRLDTVNLIDADCSVVTSIDIDHVEYLGNTRESIGFEKAGIFRPQRPAICGDPVPPHTLIDHAAQVGADLWRFGVDFNYAAADSTQWHFAARGVRRTSLPYPALRGANQLLNACAALAALEALREVIPVDQGAVRAGLTSVELPGRFQVLAGRPVVVMDVAHNPHAAAALAHNLSKMGFFRYTYAVFGALADKDLVGLVRPLVGQVDHWFLAPLDSPRSATAAQLATALGEAGFVADGTERTLTCCASAADAYAAARGGAHEDDRILVFGSFYTVAAVMTARASEATPRPPH